MLPPTSCVCLYRRNITETLAGVSAPHKPQQNPHSSATTVTPPTMEPAPTSPAKQPTSPPAQVIAQCLVTAAPAPAQPLISRFASEPKHYLCRQTLRILQWNANGLATKQHELRLRLKGQSIEICLIQETKLLPKNTTPSFPGFCTIRADRPTNQIGGRGSSHSFETI